MTTFNIIENGDCYAKFILFSLASPLVFDGKIVGGKTINIADVPYQVSLQSWGNHICGASIINEFWVLVSQIA